MLFRLLLPLVATIFLTSTAFAQMVDCACDLANPESMKARQCSLCVEAEKHPTDKGVIVVKDINPRKPNRFLVLPRGLGPQEQSPSRQIRPHT